MSQSPVSDQEGALWKCLENLRKIREEAADPAVFWRLFIESVRDVSAAEAGLIAVRGSKDGSAWQPVLFHPESVRTGPFAQTLMGKLNEAVEACAAEGAALLDIEGGDLAAMVLKTGVEGQTCLALLYLGRVGAARAAEAVKALKLIKDVPASYQLGRSAQEAITRQEQFAGVLDLMALMTVGERFLSSAMTFCNELSSRHRCERVSMGWLKDGYMRLAAMSHVDDFDKKTEVVERLELAMEEAYDQDAEIVLPFPQAQAGKIILRDHEAFARAEDSRHVCSLPLRVNGRPVAVCTLERHAGPFAEAELRLLRLICDQAAPRLNELKRRDRWFGARLAENFRPNLEKLMGHEHAWPKALAAAGFLALAFICFVPVTYRLEAPAILRTDDVMYLTAPFDGHIEKAAVRVGEDVAEGAELLRLDRNELFLEEAGILAEKNRYQREGEKARASNALADMRISDALFEQSSARLDLVRHKLGQAVIRAPYAGVVVEGDQMERAGSPVKQGDVLFKVGRIDRVYAELEIPESEVHHVKAGQTGEISLASRPGDTFQVGLDRVEPAAMPKEEGNVFLARAAFPGEFPQWWRPGMTGLAKVRAGKRTLLWIFTHRTMDFLRLKLWW